MIRFAEAEEVLPLRSKVLRNGKPLAECSFDGDRDENTFHLAEIIDKEIICVATFHSQPHPNFAGNAYQLRGMATAEHHRGKGIGNQVLNFGIVYLRGKQIRYLWCNARKAAYSFYFGQGFEFISEEFEISEIGPHRTMYLKIR